MEIYKVLIFVLLLSLIMITLRFNCDVACLIVYIVAFHFKCGHLGFSKQSCKASCQSKLASKEQQESPTK